MGWVLVILGVFQLTGGYPLDCRKRLRTGDRHHRRKPRRIDALLSMGGTHPFWSLGIFALCVWIVYGIAVLGSDEPTETRA